MATLRSTYPLVWVDCEMTGLDVQNDSILSIACFITDYQLNVIEPNGWEAIIHHEKSRLDQMDEWCTQHHGQSGLIAATIASKTTAEEAAEGLFQYVKQHVPKARVALLAGNSVHADKAFLSKTPYEKVLQHLHYRIFDVSSLKEAVRRWAPDTVLGLVPKKQNLHTAREDILESIEEARFYKGFFDGSTQNSSSASNV
ncbi:MAG: hypothetical protein M1834_000694 [Cirrosporium novae-zelandiae]|nr:MAG: hypothetical protein M1834_000694 [Cirrosporium novae-zelandiae]